MKRDIPFSTSILSLIMMIVVPLAAILLGLGWRATETLEGSVVALRMAALEAAVTGWLTGGLRAASMVGQTRSVQKSARSGGRTLSVVMEIMVSLSVEASVAHRRAAHA